MADPRDTLDKWIELDTKNESLAEANGGSIEYDEEEEDDEDSSSSSS